MAVNIIDNNEEPFASEETFEEIYKILCENASQNSNPNIFFDALKQKNLHINSLYYKIEFFILDCHGTLLHHAIWKSDLNTIKYLILLNIDINKVNSSCDTPLFIAVNENQVDIVQFLLQQPNIETNRLNKSGCIPLYTAVYENRKDIVQLLLLHDNVDVNKPNNMSKTPLMAAVIRNRIDILKMLLQHKNLDVNQPDKIPFTPLFWAVTKDKVDAVKLLIQHKNIDINKPNSAGQTPLYIAVHHLDIFRILIQNENVDVNKTDDYGNSPLHQAVHENEAEAVKLLIQQSETQQNIRNNNSETPLDIAVRLKFHGVKKLLT